MMNVSVVIPSFNAERFVGQTIRSVLAQTRPPEEIIVVDDGSTDETGEIVRSFGSAVTFVELGHGGACRVRNHGASLARGDALMFLDSDDVLGPEVLQHLVETLHRVPRGIALCSWNRLELVNGQWVRRPASCAPRVPGDDVLGAWLSGWYHPPCSVLWSREGYDVSGGWDETLPGNPNDDGDIMMRALARGAPALVTDQGTAFYRRHDTGLPTLSGRRFSVEGLQARMRVLMNLAGVLQEENRLGTYRAHLGAAFDHLADDCREHAPALVAECERLAGVHGGPRWQRQVRRSERYLRARVGDVFRLLADPSGVGRRRRDKRNPVEVRYGDGEPISAGRGKAPAGSQPGIEQ